MQVTSNCYPALRHLRNKLGNFAIWIGAICINQKDEAEKDDQISFMGNIYSKAPTVYVWLREGDVATDGAMAYFKVAGNV